MSFPAGKNWLAAAREESAEEFFTRGASRIVFSLPDGMNCWAARLAEKHSLCVDAELFPGMNARVEELLASKYRTEAWRSGVRHGRPSQPR